MDAVLTHILAEKDLIYPQLEERARQLAIGVEEILLRRRIPHVIQNAGPMISVTLTLEPIDAITSYRQARRYSDVERYIQFQHALLDRGVYVHPNQFEPIYLSVAHCKEDIDEVLSRFDDTFHSLLD